MAWCGVAWASRSTGHTPIFDPRQKLRGGSTATGFPTVVNPRARASPLSRRRSRVILSLSSGRVNSRKAVIPDLPEIIDCIFIYDEKRRVRPTIALCDRRRRPLWFFDGVRVNFEVTVEPGPLYGNAFYRKAIKQRVYVATYYIHAVPVNVNSFLLSSASVKIGYKSSSNARSQITFRIFSRINYYFYKLLLLSSVQEKTQRALYAQKTVNNYTSANFSYTSIEKATAKLFNDVDSKIVKTLN